MRLSIHPNYRNIYYLTYVVNILIGIFFIVNYGTIKGFNTESIILIILMSLCSLVVLFCFFKKKKKIEKFDLVFMWTYIVYVILFLVLCLNYQRLYFNTYNLLYFKNYLIGPYIIFVIEGFLSNSKKVNLQKHKN